MVFVDSLNCRGFVTSYAVTGLFAMEQRLPGSAGPGGPEAGRAGFQWMQGRPALKSVRV